MVDSIKSRDQREMNNKEQREMKKANPILTALSAATFGFFIGISFPLQMAPQLPCYVFPWNGGGGGGDAANSTLRATGMLSRFWVVGNNNNNNTAAATEGKATTAPAVVHPNATSPAIIKPTGAERLPPNIVVSESDLHMRRLWGDPRQDTPVRKYLLTMTVGLSEKANVNATVHKFSDEFDVMLFHYDGRTTEWDDEFAWSKDAIHVSARKQAKWWYAKRFLHPSVVAPYDYVFLWDEDLAVDFFDATEYVRIVREHGLEISQPGLDITRGKKTYDITTRRSNNTSEVHKNTTGGPGNCPDVHRRPCSGFVEVMAPVFSRKAWACAWYMVQNDLIHGWGLDLNFWRCVDDPEEQMGVVDAQYIAHRGLPTLGRQGNPETGGGGNVRARAWQEFSEFKTRIRDADRAAETERRREAAAALLVATPPTPSPPRSK
ncbi:hypothetical protein SETIT_4G287000v2 [Setaria italica]|uniref:Uncharacterized protein n=3 Tax=Setaria italica TaxID=4555 RepID=A0A368QZ99_SETIT|nr:hypothetical protein SETIT_4G287000v2 [Setaria italica]